MSKPFGNDDWWDFSYNPVGGCRAVSPGCTHCYAAQDAGTKTWPYPGAAGVHEGVTHVKDRRRIFNGEARVAPPGHSVWFRLPRATNPKLGPDQPSLLFVGSMGDLFYEKHPTQIITKVCATIALSEHIGLLLTKRTRRAAEYFTALDARTVRRWQPQLWPGFSAERQQEFDARWVDMRRLADAGWFIFVSIAPMIGPMTLPPDFLALGNRTWVIVAGEQGKHALCRDMDPRWARAIRDQCRAAAIPFFMKQMARKEPIPPDLLIRQFPSVNEGRERNPARRNAPGSISESVLYEEGGVQ
jgi:protein gp37